MGNAIAAQARININKMLDSAGWRFFDHAKGKATLALEPNVRLSHDQIDDLDENFEPTRNGFVDFLLPDEKGFPLVDPVARTADKIPLVRKEQARKYATSLNWRFVILLNGDLHYFRGLRQDRLSVKDIDTRFNCDLGKFDDSPVRSEVHRPTQVLKTKAEE